MTAPQDPFRSPDDQPGPYGPPPGAPGSGQPGYDQPGGPQGFGQPDPGRPGDPFGGSQQVGEPGQPGEYGAQVGPGGYGGGYGSPPVVRKNGFGVAALVLGILALLLSWTIIGGVLLGIAAIVLGVLGRGRAKRGEADNGGIALAGLILGVLGLLVSIAIIAAGASFLSRNSGSFSDLTSCLQEAQGDANAEAECQSEFEDDLTN